MNYEKALNLLRVYQVQNPNKYIQKYGNVMPEEAASKLAGIPSAPTGILGVQVEVKDKEAPTAVEMEFAPPKEELGLEHGDATPIMKVKRGQK